MVIMKTKTFTSFMMLSFVGGCYVTYRKVKNDELREEYEETVKKEHKRFHKKKKFKEADESDEDSSVFHSGCFNLD